MWIKWMNKCVYVEYDFKYLFINGKKTLKLNGDSNLSSYIIIRGLEINFK